MKKKYQYFVSSTYIDLIEERTEIISSILNLGGIPVGMEFFPATGVSQINLIKRLMDDCDYYVLILAGRYGSVDDSGKSYTEIEYDYAIEKGIPIISFLHKDIDSLPRNKTELDNTAYQKVKDFREKAKIRNCQFWADAKDLSTKVTASLAQAIILTPRPGWVRVNERIQQVLFPSIERSGNDFLMIHLKGLDFEVNVYIQFFEENPHADSFDDLVKSKAYKLEQDGSIFKISKRDILNHKGQIFKLFCKVKKEHINRIYELLCSNGYTVNGPGHEDSNSKGTWLVWFLTSQEPVNFASGHVGTINQILTSNTYPRVKRKHKSHSE
ncbi:MAG: DUF4062 domain-containing protein [Marinifilaceae bacterium]|nr:DUF4062 domain-containing protein [Marinifilaceae bacterium]